MKISLSDSLALILITAWVGGLWAIGYLAAPALFYTLGENRQLAGNLAGTMFTWVAYLGLFSGIYLLAHRVARYGLNAFKQAFFWTVLVMLLLTLFGHFGVQPPCPMISPEKASSSGGRELASLPAACSTS